VKPVKIVKRSFPDGETYLKVPKSVKGKEVIVISALNNPNPKTFELMLLSRTLRDNGAKKVGLIAPYLAYMRQDKIFKAGEGISAKYYAALISEYFDWLITVDPHLHRIHYLCEVYKIPTVVIHAAPFIGNYIKKHIQKPLLIGPDNESSQWVKEVANDINAPFEVLEKIRIGDKNVKESMPHLSKYKGFTPVLVDDIISTGQTMLTAVKNLKKAGMKGPVCIGVHAVFANHAFLDLLETGAVDIISCNTISNPSNKINVCAGLETLL
jgi:ribose-phosphate pyrophosphokinase